MSSGVYSEDLASLLIALGITPHYDLFNPLLCIPFDHPILRIGILGRDLRIARFRKHGT